MEVTMTIISYCTNGKILSLLLVDLVHGSMQRKKSIDLHIFLRLSNLDLVTISSILLY